MYSKVRGKRVAAHAEPPTPTDESARCREGLDAGETLPALARAAVETFVRERRLLGRHSVSHESLITVRAACFVCIKTDRRELRGCVGTIEPSKPTLAEEVIANAVSAASQDPRFSPVNDFELLSLNYSVDVLETPEPASFDDLDPKTYGVIVEDETHPRRGLLLPDIEGVETTAQQIQIAARKAGISLLSPYKLYRFRVHRYVERACAEHFSEQGD